MKILTLLLATLPVLSLLAATPSALENARADARTLLEKGEFAAALEKSTFLNKSWPDDSRSYQLIAAAQMGLGNYAEAERAVQWMLDLRIGKADASGWMVVAQFREVTGDIDGAMDAMNLAYGQMPSTDRQMQRTLLTYSAHLETMTGKFKSAESLINRALLPVPADESALEALARLRIAQERPDEALTILRALAKSSSRPRHLWEIARLTQDEGDYAAFEKEAVAHGSDANNANRELALYYAGPGHRPADAEKIARQEAARRHDVFTLDALAAALLANHKNSEAREIMKRVVAVGSKDPEIARRAALLGVRPE